MLSKFVKLFFLYLFLNSKIIVIIIIIIIIVIIIKIVIIIIIISAFDTAINNNIKVAKIQSVIQLT